MTFQILVEVHIGIEMAAVPDWTIANLDQVEQPAFWFLTECSISWADSVIFTATNDIPEMKQYVIVLSYGSVF